MNTIDKINELYSILDKAHIQYTEKMYKSYDQIALLLLQLKKEAIANNESSEKIVEYDDSYESHKQLSINYKNAMNEAIQTITNPQTHKISS